MLHSIFYVVLFLLTLVISNVLNKIFPKLALPLIQVLIGILLGALGVADVLHVEPELFLGFIIGPLLFRESEKADLEYIFKHWRLILFLILPLVFISALGLGFLLNRLYLAIPLAACIALGASLGPTDAVAVSALTERLSFPRRVLSSLQGEGLLNDASGIIAFQLALASLYTGKFSLGHASLDLAITAVGGIIVGFLVIFCKNLLLQILADVNARELTSYLLIELTIPLISFLIADLLAVSGIIAVVTAGILQANALKKTTLFDAQISQIKGNLWDMIVFALNSAVFLFLGIELHELIIPLFLRPAYSNFWLIMLVLILTLALFAIRFILLLLYHWILAKRQKLKANFYFTDVLLLTFSGSKGTVSIATILLLPRLIPGASPLVYSLLIFLASAVTAVSFIVGLVVLPVIAAKKETKVNNLTEIAILNEVVEELTKDQKQYSDDKSNKQMKEALEIAIDSYQDRIQQLIIEQESSGTSSDFNELQLMISRIELEGLEKALQEKRISMSSYQLYQRYIHSLEQNIKHKLVSSLQFAKAVIHRALQLLLTNILYFSLLKTKSEKLRDSNQELFNKQRQEITEIYFQNTELILQALQNLSGIYEPRLIKYLQLERLRAAKAVASGSYISRLLHRHHPDNLSAMMRAYYLERKVIYEFEAAEKITEKEGRELRQNVNTMEDYSLAGDQQNFFMDLAKKRLDKKAKA